MQSPELDSNYLEFATQLASKIEQFLIQTHEVNLRSAEHAQQLIFDTALAGSTPGYLRRGVELHYYFAHKWAFIFQNLLTRLVMTQRSGLASELYRRFYQGNDRDRLRMLSAEIGPMAYQMGLTGELYDPEDPAENGLFGRIEGEVGEDFFGPLYSFNNP